MNQLAGAGILIMYLEGLTWTAFIWLSHLRKHLPSDIKGFPVSTVSCYLVEWYKTAIDVASSMGFRRTTPSMQQWFQTYCGADNQWRHPRWTSSALNHNIQCCDISFVDLQLGNSESDNTLTLIVEMLFTESMSLSKRHGCQKRMLAAWTLLIPIFMALENPL